MKKIYSFGIALMLAMLASMTLYAQPAELLARYPLDETEGNVAADVSGNGFDAAIFCEFGDCLGQEGTIEGAMAFGGTDSIVLPADVMGLTNDNGSVAMWIKAAEPTQINTLFWGGDNTTGGGFGPENEMHLHLEQAATDIWVGGEVSWVVQLGDESGQTFLFSDPWKGGSAGTPPSDQVVSVTDEEWHHVAATWGEGMVKLYVDGVNIWGDTTAYAPTVPYDLTHMYLGKMGGGGRTFMGTMDDARIYTGVLTDMEVETLFNKDFTRLNQRVADDSQLSVYPNPAGKNTSVRFNAEGGEQVSIDLYNLTGARVGNIYNGRTVSGENLVDLNTESFGSGLYLLEVQVGSRVSHTKFVVK